MVGISFETKADEFLSSLSEKLDEEDSCEVDFSDGVLIIKARNGEYAINRHSATETIWYSSPVSNLKYFSLVKDEFIDRKTGDELTNLLMQDLSKKT